MNFKNYQNAVSNVYAKNRLYKFGILVALVIVAINTVITTKAVNSRVTVIVPPGLTEKAEIQNETASDAYIKQMVRYIIPLRTTFTRLTARSQFDELLTIYAPESYPEAKGIYYDLADTIENSGDVTSIYILHKLELYSNQPIVEVRGMRRLYIEDKKAEEVRMTYKITYKINGGTFYIVNIEETTGR